MDNKSIAFLFLAFLLHLTRQDEGKNYTAVVVEYSPSPEVTKNIELYDDIIWNSKGRFHADIVIFPESALTVQREWASLVPDPKQNVIPYKNETYKDFKAIQAISKAAAENKVYVVINLIERENCTKGQDECPERGYFLYNTNVAFDRKGTVVARYRKVNIYDVNINRPKEKELSTFTTDFGVTFGLITCFDILFKTPGIDLVEQKKVKNIIFTNRWYGELPFLTAVQVQGGWSYAMNVTLLASGANNPTGGSTGTGIYFGRKSNVHYMYETAGTMYFGWDMSKIPNKSEYLLNENLVPESRVLNLLQDPTIPLAKNATLSFGRTQFRETICHNGLCCKFDIDYTTLMESSPDGYSYKAVAFQGERIFGNRFRHEVAYCAVVLCVRGNCAVRPPNDNFPLLFKKMKIQGEFKSTNTLQMPNTLTWKTAENDLRLLHLMDYDAFDFEKKNTGKGNSLVTMNLNKYTKNLMTFGIFGRKFD